jgi:hypothetical protein
MFNADYMSKSMDSMNGFCFKTHILYNRLLQVTELQLNVILNILYF